VGGRLALRPGFSARARMPPTARFAPRGARRGLLVLTAGPVPYFYGRYPGPAGWMRRYLIAARGSRPFLFARKSTERLEDAKIMTFRTSEFPQRRRGNLGSQRLRSVIDARRRLDAGRADGTRSEARPVESGRSATRGRAVRMVWRCRISNVWCARRSLACTALR
jgi:hypothetical protein